MELPLIHLDKSQLYRAGFRHIVQNSQFHVGWDGPSWKEAGPAIMSLKPVMIVADLTEQHAQFEQFLGWVATLPYSPKIVLFAAGLPSEDVVPLMSRIDGYIAKNLPGGAIVHALQLIHGGQKIFPPEIINLLVKSASQDRQGPPGLSERELQILGFLRSGHSNKRIARDLAIAEGTVKSHLKAVMKKVHATNRTQAAMWAVSKGIRSE